MEVVRNVSRYVSFRTALAAAAVVAALGAFEPARSPAAAEQPSFRRLVELESSRTFSDELTAALMSTDTRLAARAALALGRTEDARAAGPLRNASERRDVALRALAVYGYGLLAGKPGVSSEPISRALRDRAGPVRFAAIDAAWRERAARVPGAEAFAPALLAALRGERDPILRARAATALSAWSDSPRAAAIAGDLAAAERGESDPTVRWHEAWTLRRGFAAHTPEAAIRDGVRDADETVRIQFADLLGRRKDLAAVRQLEPLLKDPAWRVREQAYESIKLLAGGPRSEHLAAIPEVVGAPSPEPDNTESPLPRPGDLGPPRKPIAADAVPSPKDQPPVLGSTVAQLDGQAAGPHPRIRIATTKGTIVVRLFPEWAPLTVANFLGLAERGYYDGLRWFRVVPDFVAQTGDKTETGDGDAGYTIPAEENPLEQRAGIISMGLNYTEGNPPAPVRDSAGTQFYLTVSPQLHLNRDFTVFGAIESGFSTLGRLVESDRMTRVERLADR